MPRVFKIGSYWVYFWSNENDPLEPVHVHISEGAPLSNATKVWIKNIHIIVNRHSRVDFLHGSF